MGHAMTHPAQHRLPSPLSPAAAPARCPLPPSHLRPHCRDDTVGHRHLAVAALHQLHELAKRPPRVVGQHAAGQRLRLTGHAANHIAVFQQGVGVVLVINNQLHVDGAVVDNLPIETMYQFPVKHVIAISLTKLKSRNVEFEEMPSATQLLWQKVTGRRKYRIPDIGSILINSLTLNSRQKQEIRKTGVDLYVELDLKGVGMLNGKRWKEIMQKGYEQMQQALQHFPQAQRFW